MKITNISNCSKQNRITYSKNKVSRVQNNTGSVNFKGNPNFILLNSIIDIAKKQELDNISKYLTTLGVKELELGDNIDLARLLKIGLQKIKMRDYQVPTRIKCNSKYFDNNPRLTIDKEKWKKYYDINVPAFCDWDYITEPVMYFNPKSNWKDHVSALTKNASPCHPIWHECGHWLHMKNHNPVAYTLLKTLKLTEYEKGILKDTLGDYSTDSTIEAIAEIFVKLISDGNHNNIPLELFQLYSKYYGPLPKPL